MERGVAMFRKVFGDTYGSYLASRFAGDEGSFSHIVMTRIGPEIWERDNLDIRAKVLCAIGIFTALGKEEVRFFMRAAIIHGCSRAEIEDVLLLAGLESGFPNAAAAARILDEAEEEQRRFEAEHGR
jgi:alkylhydroperoxidase/carboxymuconolactone decarboxylase family protein YurZ